MDCNLRPCSATNPRACDLLVQECYEICDYATSGCRGGCSAVANCSRDESCEAIVVPWNYTAIPLKSDSIDELSAKATKTHALWAGYKSPALPQHELLIKSALTPGKTFDIF